MPCSAADLRTTFEPPAAIATRSCGRQSPLSTSGTGRLPSGLAGALLAFRDASGEEEQQTCRLDALKCDAVKQLAPHLELGVCTSPACSWRWAAWEIVRAYREMSQVEQGVRAILDEEFGDAARRRLADLTEEHEALRTAWEAGSHELESSRRCCERWQRERDEETAACNEATDARRAAEDAQAQLEIASSTQVAALKSRLEGELAEARKPTGRLAKARGLREEAEKKHESFQQRLKPKDDKHQRLTMEVAELRAKFEYFAQKETEDKQKKKKLRGRSSSNRKPKARPVKVI